MIRSYSSTYPVRLPFWVLLIALLGLVIYLSMQHQTAWPIQTPIFTKATDGPAPPFPHRTITSDLRVDWTGGGDFDPRNKCPDDFFGAGFVVICKKMADGKAFKFLYHKGKKLLYRIDKDMAKGKARIGLHWVESTRFSAKYRIADPAYKGGKTVSVPDGKGGGQSRVFQYGEAVSPKRVQRHRELFHETHIHPKQCDDWWDIFNFIP